jgi:hypothetical protein
MAMTMNAMGPGLVRIDPAARDWKLTLVRGVAALAFGILCFVWPALSLFALVLLWGVYALVDGISAILWGTRSRWWSMVAVGVVSVVAGLVAFFWPGITALALRAPGSPVGRGGPGRRDGRKSGLLSTGRTGERPEKEYLTSRFLPLSDADLPEAESADTRI